jgi:hypothetical protein
LRNELGVSQIGNRKEEKVKFQITNIKEAEIRDLKKRNGDKGMKYWGLLMLTPREEAMSEER